MVKKMVKKNYIFVVILLLFVNSVYATTFDFYRNDGSSGTTFDVGYEGKTNEIPNTVVKNNNVLCSIRCSFQTSQSKSGTVPGVSGGFIPANMESPRFSIPVVAQGSKILTTTVTCYDEDSTFCSSSNSKQLSKELSLSWDFCGDGIKQPTYETCDGGSISCFQLGSNYYSTKSASCKSDCSGYITNVCEYCGDGSKNGPEACDSGSRNGVKCSPPYGSSCTYCDPSCITQTIKGPYCGDSSKDSPENCNNCPQDAGCKDTEQCSSSGVCINIVNDDDNCGSIGHRCDTTPKQSYTGESSCSSDYSKAIQIQQITKEQCKHKTCEKVIANKNVETDCLVKRTYCQDGACGCSESYEVCESLKRCVKKKEVKLNQPCNCDFQCEMGFCDSGQCVGGLNIQLSSEKSTLSIGEETTISLSVSNPLSRDVDADIVLNLGSGVELVEVLSGDQCSGSQCKLDKTKIPEGSKKDVTVRVKAKSDVNSLMTATVTYGLEGRKEPIEISEKNTIKIIECGNGKIDEGETSETCCIDAGCPADNQFYGFTCNKKTKSCDKSLHSYYIYGGIGILILVFLIIFGITLAIKHHKKSSSKKDKKKGHEKETEKKEQEEALEEKHSSNESITKQIEHLHSLMEKGILTEREFKKKKKKLLKKLK